MLGARVVTIGVAAILLALLWLSPVAGSQDDWNCNLRVYVGEIGGAPADTGQYFGVRPDASDEYEQGDSKKPGVPQGDYAYAWFQHPNWGQGPIAADWRAPLPEASTKSWGVEPPLPFLPPTDYLGVKTNVNGDGPGCDDPCGYGMTYPAAAAIYLTWEFGVGEGVPAPLPPDDYTFTLKYKGGINAKPAGCLPPGVAVPANNTTWDMRTTSSIAIPLWSAAFQPFSADCMNYAPSDTAKFVIIVANPEGEPEGGGAGTGGTGLPEMPVGDMDMFAGSSGGGTQGPLGGGGIVETITSPVLEGDAWHLISLPARPSNPDPWEVFDELRPPNNSLDLLSGCLFRYDLIGQGYIPYINFEPGSFGEVRDGEGYWLYLFEDTQISYEGYRNIGTQAINLTCKGKSGSRWALIGSPFDWGAVQVADCVFQNRQTLVKKDPQEALAAGWIGLPLYRYEPGVGYVSVGVYETDVEHGLLPWFGYWLDPPKSLVMRVKDPDPNIGRLHLWHAQGDFEQDRNDAECSNVKYEWTDTITSSDDWPGGVMVQEHHYGVNMTWYEWYGYDPDYPGYNYFDENHAAPPLVVDTPRFSEGLPATSNKCEGYLFIPEAGTWWFGMWVSGCQWDSLGMCQGAQIIIDGTPLLFGGTEPPDVLPPGKVPPWDWIHDAFPPWYEPPPWYDPPHQGVYFASLELDRGLYSITTRYFSRYPDGSTANTFRWTRNANPAAQQWANDAWRPQEPYYTCKTPDNPNEDIGVYTSKWYNLGSCTTHPEGTCCIPEAARIWWASTEEDDTIPGGAIANGTITMEYQFKASLEDADPTEWQSCNSDAFLNGPMRYFRYRATLSDPNPNDLVLDEFELTWWPYPGVILKDFVVHNPPTDPPIPEDTPYIVCNHAVTDPDDPEQPVIEYTIEDPVQELYPGSRGSYTIILTVGSAEEDGPGTDRVINDDTPDPNVDHTTPGPKSHTWWDLWQGNPPSAPGIFWYNVEVYDQCGNRDHRLSEYLEIVEHRVEFSHSDEAEDIVYMRVLNTLTDSTQPAPIPASQAYVDVYAEDFAPVVLRVPAPTTTIAPPGVPNENPNVAEVSLPDDADDCRYVIVAVDGHATAETYAEWDSSPPRVRPAREVNKFRLKPFNAWTHKNIASRTTLWKHARVWELELAAGYRIPRCMQNPSGENVRLELHKDDHARHDATVYLLQGEGPDIGDPGHGQVYACSDVDYGLWGRHLIIATDKDDWDANQELKDRYSSYAWWFLDDWGEREEGGKWADRTKLAVLSACGLADDLANASSFIARRHHEHLGIDCVIWLHPKPQAGFAVDRDASNNWFAKFASYVFKPEKQAEEALTVEEAMDLTNQLYKHPVTADPAQCPVASSIGGCADCKVSPPDYGVVGYPP